MRFFPILKLLRMLVKTVEKGEVENED